LASSKPFLSAVVASAFAFGAQLYLGDWGSPLLRLVLEGGVMAATYVLMLLYAMGQSTLYLDVLKGLRADPGSLDS
jgi:hypothetical protein